MSEDKRDLKAIPPYARFMLGGLAGMTATLLNQPMDMVKNRMQMSAVGGMEKQKLSTFQVISQIIKKEGVLELYNGLTAGLLRQATLTTTRLGVTTSLIPYTVKDKDTAPTMVNRTICAIIGGTAGGIVGNPADVSMIRMTSDGRLPPSERRNYKSVFDALHRIIQEEGVTRLWVGVVPAVMWAAVGNTSQLTTYSMFKGLLLEQGILKDGITCHFASSFAAGLVATILTMPIDIAKTRLQNMKTINGVPEHSGMLDVLFKIVTKEGVIALWKGFTPYYLRLGTHTIMLLIFVEEYIKLYRVYILGDKTKGRSVF